MTLKIGSLVLLGAVIVLGVMYYRSNKKVKELEAGMSAES